MLLARDKNSHRIEPKEGAEGFCDCCNAQLVPKCGRIRIHHWSHKVGDCDPWYEPESAWHRWWKQRAPREWCEVAIGQHRADIRRNDGLVIELQHSSISPDDVEKREAFYQNMVWIVDAQNYKRPFVFSIFEDHVTLQWRKFPERWTFAKKTLYFDFGARIVELVDRKGYYGAIRGIAHTRENFLRMFGLDAEASIDNTKFGIWVRFKNGATGHEPKDMPIPASRARFFNTPKSAKSLFGGRSDCQVLFADGTEEDL